MITLTKQESELFGFLMQTANRYGSVIRVAGGWVRDKIMGLHSDDIDIAVDNMSGKAFCELCNVQKIAVIEARPEQSKHLETARIRLFDFDIDFCALRKETYSDSRIPKTEPGTPEEDAGRRDLTINALFYNINTGHVEDYTTGIQDLNEKIARTPIDAYQTFIDDPLRILRTIRFASRYSLSIDQSIIDAAKDKIVQDCFKTKISRERIFAELFGYEKEDGFKSGILCSAPHVGLTFLKEIGFIDILFSPDNISLNPWDTWQNNPHHDLNILDHTLKAIEYFDANKRDLSPQDIGIVILALMCHDLGKRDSACIQVKDNGYYSYLGHDDRSVELADIVLDQIGCYSYIKERVLKIVRHHMRYHALEDNPTDKSLRRIIRDIGDDWKLLLVHSEADSCGKLSVDTNSMKDRHSIFRFRTNTCLETQGNTVKIKRPVSGFDLIQAGIEPGIKMGELFKILDEALLDDPNMTKESAMEIILNANNI